MRRKPALRRGGSKVLNWGDARVGNIIFSDDLAVGGRYWTGKWSPWQAANTNLDGGSSSCATTPKASDAAPRGDPRRDATIAYYEQITGHQVKTWTTTKCLAGTRLAILMVRAAHMMIAAGLLPPDVADGKSNPASQLVAKLLVCLPRAAPPQASSATGDSEMNAQMMFQRICAFSGIICLLLFFGGFVAAGFLPPLAPGSSAQEIAAHYQDHATGIRFGAGLIFLSSMFYAWFTAVISGQMRRIPGVHPTVVNAQLVAGAFGCVTFLLPALLFAVTAFRPDRSPDATLLFNDMSWIILVMPWPPFMAQYFAFAFAIFADQRPKPLFPGGSPTSTSGPSSCSRRQSSCLLQDWAIRVERSVRLLDPCNRVRCVVHREHDLAPQGDQFRNTRRLSEHGSERT